MIRRGHHGKTVVRWVLGVIVALDVALLGVNWDAMRSPRAPRDQLALLREETRLMERDVRRGEAIRAHLPEVQRQCDRFFADDLQPAATGYSAIAGDLGAIAHKAGLQTSTVTFREQRAPDARGVVEIQVVTAVQGDYGSVVEFINGLEHSKKFYVLDGLQLAPSTGGNLKLNLQLRTYFRSS